MLPPFGSLTIAAAALAAVLAMIWLAQRLMRIGGLARNRPNARLALIDQVALDPRRKLQLVRCDDRVVLMLTGGNRDLVVGWLPYQETRPDTRPQTGQGTQP